MASPATAGEADRPTLYFVIGPILLMVAGGVAGGLTEGWPGAVAGVALAVFVTFGVAAAAAWWAGHIGRSLDPATAWALAPRPPLFGALCDAVYRRALGRGPVGGGDQDP
jgi:hypothetical protein